MASETNDLTFVRCPTCRSLVPASATRCRICNATLEAGGKSPAAGEAQAQASRVRQKTVSADMAQVQAMVGNPSQPPPAMAPVDPKPTFAQAVGSEPVAATVDDFDPLGAFLQDLDAAPQPSSKSAASAPAVPEPAKVSAKVTDRFSDDDESDDDDDDDDDLIDFDDLGELDDLDQLDDFDLDLEDDKDEEEVAKEDKRAAVKAAADTDERFLDLLDDDDDDDEDQDDDLPPPQVKQNREPEVRTARPQSKPEVKAPRAPEPPKDFKPRSENKRPSNSQPSNSQPANQRQMNQNQPGQGRGNQPNQAPQNRPKFPQPGQRQDERPGARLADKPKGAGQPPQQRHDRDRNREPQVEPVAQTSARPQHMAAQTHQERAPVEPSPRQERQPQQAAASNGPRTNKMKPGRLFGWLVSYESPDGRAIELRAGRFFITGTSIRGTDLILEDQSISTPHALMSITDNGLQIQDLMSERGTFVRSAGDTQYRREEGIIEVRHGDWIRFGDVEFLVTIVPS